MAYKGTSTFYTANMASSKEGELQQEDIQATHRQAFEDIFDGKTVYVASGLTAPRRIRCVLSTPTPIQNNSDAPIAFQIPVADIFKQHGDSFKACVVGEISLVAVHGFLQHPVIVASYVTTASLADIAARKITNTNSASMSMYSATLPVDGTKLSETPWIHPAAEIISGVYLREPISLTEPYGVLGEDSQGSANEIDGEILAFCLSESKWENLISDILPKNNPSSQTYQRNAVYSISVNKSMPAIFKLMFERMHSINHDTECSCNPRSQSNGGDDDGDERVPTSLIVYRDGEMHVPRDSYESFLRNMQESHQRVHLFDVREKGIIKTLVIELFPVAKKLHGAYTKYGSHDALQTLSSTISIELEIITQARI